MMFEYQPGRCNIGARNIRNRRVAGFGLMALTVGLAVAFQRFSGIPDIVHFSLAVPLFFALLCHFQAKQGFCVVHGLRGTYHSDQRRDVVTDMPALMKDRRKALEIILVSLLVTILLVGAYRVFVVLARQP
jgi:hypothetical protein